VYENPGVWYDEITEKILRGEEHTMKLSGYVIKSANVVLGDAKILLVQIAGAARESAENDIPDGGASQAEVSDALHSHNNYEIQIVLNGGCNVKSDKKNVLLSNGEMIVIRPNDLHVVTLPENEKEPFERIVLNLQIDRGNGEKGFYEYFKSLLDNYAMNAFEVPGVLRDKILLFLQLKPTNIMESSQEKVAAYEVVYSLFEAIAGFGAVHPDGFTEKNVLREHEAALLDVLVNQSVHLPLSEIARRMGYSVKQVSRIIRKTYGVSYKKMQKSLQMNSAKKLLLEEPDMPIRDVILKIGGSSVTSFYRDFDKYVGCTPREYREQMLGDKERSF